MSAMVRVPAGTFLMGENPDDKFANDTERPRHTVTIRSFLLAEHPVTVAEFREFRPEHEPGAPADWPAAAVSWYDATAYCEWLGNGARLPGEAEWEYAARAGSVTPYPWGDTISPDHANYFYDEQGNKVGPGRRTPCGTYPANAFGLFDMIGNVCEWTADGWHADYVGVPGDQSPRSASDNGPRVLRGGAWDYLPRLLRCSWRDRLAPGVRRDNVGFRIAADV